MNDKLKCPYNLKIVQVNQNRYEYDDDGKTIFHEHKLHRFFVLFHRGAQQQAPLHPMPPQMQHRAGRNSSLAFFIRRANSQKISLVFCSGGSKPPRDERILRRRI